MSLNEFDIITRFFQRRKSVRNDVILGSGDDCAIVKPAPDFSVAVSIDTMNEGIHFFPDTSPDDIGYKAVAISLSDLAAVGANPCWIMASLTLPSADENWLSTFCNGFFELIDQYSVELIGGDITRGPLSITTQASGYLPAKKSLRRSRAEPGDLIYVTGTLGDAGVGLKILKKELTISDPERAYFLRRLNRPIPRVKEGLALLEIAHAAIDVSDGLAADLGHILEQSHVGATVYVNELPFSTELLMHLKEDAAYRIALTAGDDYELCFTLPPHHRSKLVALEEQFGYHFHCIGVIEKERGLRLVKKSGELFSLENRGFQHF